MCQCYLVEKRINKIYEVDSRIYSTEKNKKVVYVQNFQILQIYARKEKREDYDEKEKIQDCEMQIEVQARSPASWALDGEEIRIERQMR